MAPRGWTYVPCSGPKTASTPWCGEAKNALRTLDPGYVDLGCYNPRRIAGSDRWSVHACRRAVDGHASSDRALASILDAATRSPDVQLILVRGRQWGGRNGPGWRKNTADTRGYGPRQFHIESRYDATVT